MMTRFKVFRHKMTMIFCIILVIQLFFLLYNSSLKKGYFCDELYTFGLANSVEGPFLGDFEGYWNEWKSPKFFTDYLTVQAGQRFEYDSVVYNQSMDVHPPLYYFLIHSVSSLFIESYSKWIGISINIVFFLLSEIMLFLIAGEVLPEDRKQYRLLPALFYGFSLGAANTYTFIRMYMMLAFWCLLTYYLVYRFVYSHGNKKKIWWGILVSMVCGCLTQYYFVIYAFILVFCYEVLAIIRKNEPGMLTASYFFALCVSVAFFPSMKEHILHGYRGEQAVESLFSMTGWARHLANLFEILGKHLVGFNFLWGFALILLVVVALGLRRTGWKDFLINSDHNNLIDLLVLGGLAYGYFLVISRIAPFETGRYYYLIYPFFSLLICCAIVEAVRWCVPTLAITIAYATVTVMLLIMWIPRPEIDYAYSWYEEAAEKYLDHSANSVCIYLDQESWTVINETCMFEKFKGVYPVRIEDIGIVPDALTQMEPYDNVFCFVCAEYGQEEAMNRMVETLDFATGYDLVYDTGGYRDGFGRLYILK